MPNQAAQRFGFLTEERRGRFEKGLSTSPFSQFFDFNIQPADSWSHFVACGDRNGAVHLWDLRRASTEIALVSIDFSTSSLPVSHLYAATVLQ